MDIPDRHADDAVEAAYEPTSGAQQFWWVADSVPLGRHLVIAVIALGLVGVGFGLGRLGREVIVQTVNVPILAPRADPLPTATFERSHGVVLDASIQNPQVPQFDTPEYAEFQPRLPWEEAPRYISPAQLAVDSINRKVSAANFRNMAEYVNRSHDLQLRLERPASELYYVTRRTPAYAREARFGDRPVGYLMPGTPLQLMGVQSRWARVTGPAGESLWIKAAVLSMQKTHRST